jgi:PAS domain S-box-containing protein
MANRSEERPDALRARVAELEAEVHTLRKENAELSRMHALHRAALAGAPIALGVADAAGDFLVWNDAMLAVSGFLPGQEAAWQEARQTEQARTSRGRMLEVVRRQGGLFGHEVPIPQADGTNGLAVATVRLIDVAGESLLHVTMQDVTEHKHLEGALQESELRFRQVAETLRQVFYITTADHEECLYVSPAFEKLWGRSCESLYVEPRSWIDSIHEEDRARVFEQVGLGLRDGSDEIEYRIVRPDGAIRWVLDRAYERRDAQGNPYRIVGVAEDITDRRKLEVQLREAQKMEAVGQLAGGVAHDFNNLITVILGNAMLLERASLGTSQRASLEDVKQAAMRAGDLTRKLLGFSRRATLLLQAVDLRVIVRETVGLLQRTLDPRIQIVVEQPDALGEVLADPGEMSQVLLNLCLNARDAMKEGGTLTVSTRAINVSEARACEHLDSRSGDMVCLSVVDTGSGIAPEVRGRIFEPFFTTKEPGTGTGLGLAMVFGIVKQHQGWIEFTSEPGRGTRFDVYLPLYRGTSTRSAVPDETPAPGEVRQTILFADDEAGVRRIAAQVLGERGYRVLLAGDGQAAVDLFREHWRAIDLVVLDLRMPRMSGRDALRAIRKIDPGARVLVTSGHADDYQGVVDAEKVAGCLRKPWTVDELDRALRSALVR